MRKFGEWRIPPLERVARLILSLTKTVFFRLLTQPPPFAIRHSPLPIRVGGLAGLGETLPCCIRLGKLAWAQHTIGGSFSQV